MQIDGTPGNDDLSGTDGDDFINPGSGDDTVHALGGNDYILAGGSFQGGSDTIDGGDGRDVASYDFSGQSAAVVFTSSGSGPATRTQVDPLGGVDTLTNIEEVHIFGGSGNDALTGDAGNNFIAGNAGDDTLVGGDGDDFLQGGAGNDTLDGGANGPFVDTADYSNSTAGVNVNLAIGQASDGLGGTDTLIGIEGVNGTAFADTLIGNDSSNWFRPGAGNDTVDGGAGRDVVFYEDSPTGVVVNLQAGFATGAGIGTDSLASIEAVHGSFFEDQLTLADSGGYVFGRAGNDLLTGGSGDDNFIGGSGSDTIHGGAGFDNLSYTEDSFDGGLLLPTGVGVTVNLTTGTATDNWGTIDTFDGIEGVQGSALNDTVTGNELNNFIDGGKGDDIIAGLDGNDNLEGGLGNDTLLGGNGNDFLQGGDGSDVLDGGAGTGDTAGYFSSSIAVSVNLSTNSHSGGAAGDSLLNIENINGSAFNDTLTGNAVSNFIDGGSGNDTLSGLDGNDNLAGGLGDDFLDGGNGTGDSASYFGSSGPVFVNLATGSAIGAAGNDTLVNIENLNGSSFGDTLTGDAGNNSLRGDAGNDTLIGGAGNDFITGGSGDDSIDGGAGAGDTADYFFSDTSAAVVVNLSTGVVTGGAGNDTLTGIENVNGSNFNDTIMGDSNGNFIDGRGGDDTLLGGGGRDSFVGGLGNDSIDGGAILDRANYTDLNSVSYFSSTSGVNVNLATGTAQDGLGGTDSLTNINFVTGSAYNDTFLGSSDPTLFEQFDGGQGNDIINGGALDTVLQRNSNRVNYSAASGSVTVNLASGTAIGAAGNDTLININHVTGSSFGDILVGSNSAMTEQFEGRGGNDWIDGAGGIDIVRYDSAVTAVNVNLVTGIAIDGLGGTDTLLNIEGIRGSSFDDVLTGGNPLNGTGVKDGFEAFTGNAGNDIINGGGGYDRADYLTSSAGVTVTLGGTGSGSANDGFGGMDTLISIEGVRGSAFDDILTGSDSGAFESFEGREGNDVIDGRGGIDRADYQFSVSGVTVSLKSGTAADGYGTTDSLRSIENVRGSAFNDLITGHKGSNVIEGGAGNDRINGGSGVDTAVFSGTQASYSIVKHGNKVTVSGADGIDVLKSIEILQFSDGSLTLSGKGADDQFNSGTDAADDADDDGDWTDAAGNESWRAGSAGDHDHGAASRGAGDGPIWTTAEAPHGSGFQSESEVGHATQWLHSDGTYGS